MLLFKRSVFLPQMRTLKSVCWLLLIFTGVLTSCGGQKEVAHKSSQTVTDDTGREIRIPLEIGRIVSLSPSITESLSAICPKHQLVSVTQNCDYPKEINNKPVVITYPSLDIEKLIRLKPDVIITHKGMTQQNDLKSLEDLGIPVYVASFNSASDIFVGLKKFGEITGNAERASVVVDSLKREYAEINPSTESANKKRPSVLLLVSTDPIFVYGENTLLSQLLKEAGGRNAIAGVSKDAYPQLTREMLVKINPDVIVSTTLDPLNELFWGKYPEAKLTNAYLDDQVYSLKGNYHSRPGPRFVDSFRQLIEIVRDAQE